MTVAAVEVVVMGVAHQKQSRSSRGTVSYSPALLCCPIQLVINGLNA